MHRHQYSPWQLCVFGFVCLGAGPLQAQNIPIEDLRYWQFENNAGWKALNRGDFTRAEENFKSAIKEIKPYQTSDQPATTDSVARIGARPSGKRCRGSSLARGSFGMERCHPNASAKVLPGCQGQFA